MRSRGFPAVFAVVVSSVPLATTVAIAGDYRYETLLQAGEVYSAAIALNAASDVVGQNAAGDGSYNAFVYGKGVYTQVQSLYTLTAINAKGIAAGITPTGSGATYDYASAKVTPLNLDSSLEVYQVAINAGGKLAGTVKTSQGDYEGFLIVGNVTKPLRVPGATGTYAAAIDTAGTVFGAYRAMSDGNTHGFTFRSGSYTTFDPPGSVYVNVGFVTPSGIVGGMFTDSGSAMHGFTWDGSTYRVFPSQVVGITNGGVVVEIGSVNVGGVEYPIHVPGATSTTILGANGAGTLVGDYYVQGRGTYGFIAKCPTSQTTCTK